VNFKNLERNIDVKKFQMFLVALFFGLFSHLAFADDGGNNQNQNQNQNRNAPKPEVEVVYLSRKEYDELMANQKTKDKKQKAGGDGSDDGDGDNDENKEDEDDSLQGKVRRKREREEREAAQTKELERAIAFNLGIDKFVAENQALLPAEIVQIVKLAQSERYDNQLAKASELKAAIIQSYFQVQANMDALTPAHKNAIDEYLKLTKGGREQKAAEVYENIFEPALEMARKIAKAEELGRSRAGFANPSQTDLGYKERLVKLARRTHLGEKNA